MKVAIFGAGTMGSGIAQVFAAKGHTALMYASSVASAQRHKDKLAASLNKKVARGKMTQEAADDIMSRVLVEEFEAAADADLVIECVAENMAVKKELLGRLDAICKEDAIFASNTSSLSITEMGQGLKHHLIGMHFFNPVPAMKLVEVIAGGNTPAELVEKIKNLSMEIGKTPVVVNEAPGFVVNKILIPLLQRGRLRSAGGRCLCGRYRYCYAAGLQPSHGPPASGRPDRLGHGAEHYGRAVQRDPR